MWIKNEDYEKLESERKVAERECDTWKERYVSSRLTIYELQWKIRAERETHNYELAWWKQKYADEVQKRIDLLKKMGG